MADLQCIYYIVSQKTVQNCFCQKFAILLPKIFTVGGNLTK